MTDPLTVTYLVVIAVSVPLGATAGVGGVLARWSLSEQLPGLAAADTYVRPESGRVHCGYCLANSSRGLIG